MFTEQDTGLEALSNVIGRQKQMALDLGTEVDDQNGNGSCGWEASFCFGLRKPLEGRFSAIQFWWVRAWVSVSMVLGSG